MPLYVEQATAFLTTFQTSANDWLISHGSPVLVDIKSALNPQELGKRADALGPPILSNVVGLATGAATLMAELLIMLILSFYFMVDGHRIGQGAVYLFPPRHREKAQFVRAAVGQVLGSYIRGQLILAGIVGVAAGLGSWVLGVRYPLVIGVLAFLFELVPMLGPVLSAVPAVIIALFQPWPLVAWVVVYFVAIQMIENHILAPNISGRAVGLHPVAALLALLLGADLFGIWGALFAVPITGIAAVLATALYKAWRGQPIVVERGRMRLHLPRRGARQVA